MRRVLRWRWLAVVLVAGGWAATADSAYGAHDRPTSVFGAVAHYPVGQPRLFGLSSPSGDLDGDGDVDLAITSEGTATDPASGKLVVMANDGAGRFAPARTMPLLTPADLAGTTAADGLARPAFSVGRAVAVKDVNGDGRNDIVVVDAGQPSTNPLGASRNGSLPGWVLAYLNDGTGSFTRVVTRVGARPLGMGLADFDADGVLDLGIDNEDVDAVQVLLGNGDGTFRVRQTVDLRTNPICNSPHYPQAADFNGDGRADLLVPCNVSGSLLLLKGRGDGTVGDPTLIDAGRADDFGGPNACTSGNIGAQPHSMAVDDFGAGRPGIPDVVVANMGPGQPDPNVSVFLNGPAGVLTEEPGSPYPAGNDPCARTSFPRSGQITGRPDLSADRWPDIVLSRLPNPGPQRLTLFVNQRGDGDRTADVPRFVHAAGSPYLITTTDTLREPALGDFDGDGQLDAAVVERAGNLAVLLHN